MNLTLQIFKHKKTGKAQTKPYLFYISLSYMILIYLHGIINFRFQQCNFYNIGNCFYIMKL
jgi:hypothetical protein